ncbi:SMP-30/gluconolactonase/LRE family protein [Verrucomicrobiota bacterium sgz303538]
MRPLPVLACSIALLLATTPLPFAADDWKLHPDAAEQASVPKGTVTQMPPWESKIFPGTVRDWSIYVPAQFKPDGSAAVMIFQDGHDYVNAKGNWRVPTVFDNLIAKGEMPPTVAIFINPGHDPSKGQPKSPWNGSNRSLEYDSLGDRYARFLLEEILPEVEKQYPLSKDPEKRAICGASSGGICSFTAAWERPDAFRKVLSTIGSFVNLRGGNAYPSLIRKTERKPIRVFLEDASGDLDNPFGNWPLANQQMHSALKYMGYDVRFDFGEGYGHNSKHGGSIFPDAVKWLWRSEKPVPQIDTKGDLGGDLTLLRLLIDGEDWQPVAEGLGFADGPCSDEQDNFYFSDMKAPGIFKVAPDGTRTKLSDEPASGLKFGPDGRLYACQGSKKRLIAIGVSEQPNSGALPIEVIAENVQPNDLVVSRKGHIYFTETGKQQVTFVDPKTKTVRPVDTGIAGPNGIALSPDQGTLAVSDSKGANVWTFRIDADGGLSAKEPYMTMRLPIDDKGEFKFNEPPPYKPASSGDGMTTDMAGRYYVTSALGVQVFDPTGRMCGVLTRPQLDKPLTSCTLSGPGRAYLYVTNGDKIFRRKVQAEGAIWFK